MRKVSYRVKMKGGKGYIDRSFYLPNQKKTETDKEYDDLVRWCIAEELHDGLMSRLRWEYWVNENVQGRKSATKSVPAPVSDPNTERSSNLSVLTKSKKGIAAII